MKKLMVVFFVMLAFLFASSTILPAPTDRCEDEKAQIVELEAELTAAYAKLAGKDLQINDLQSEIAIANEQLMIQDAEIVVLEQQVETAYEKVDKQAVEISVLEDKLARCYAATPKPAKGLWVGANSGIPFGVMGTAGYQFSERFMVSTGVGYLGQFQWQVGFSTRIGQ